jgi:hypothetical protein
MAYRATETIVATRKVKLSSSTPPRDLHALRNVVSNDVREGRFQRSLCLISGIASLVSGLEVTYEHYKGSYGQRIMYTPVILSCALFVAGIWGFFSRTAARSVLRAISAITLADCVIGFYFHIRGIQRKPGGWRLPLTNIVMGPPIFAPLLFGTSAYMGLIASFLQREGEDGAKQHPTEQKSFLAKVLPPKLEREMISLEQDLREGRFQNQMAVVTAASALFSGFEAWYSHYKNNFRYMAQWTPIVVAPLLAGASIAAMRNRKVATLALPIVSAVAAADAAVGFGYHARGIVRRPGGRKHLVYNILYGPPIFAPLLFGAAGMFGLLTSMLRRSKS